MKKSSLLFFSVLTLAVTSFSAFAGNDQTDANFPKDSEGRTYHLELKEGDVANRILVVGDPERAAIISKLLDDVKLTRNSPRGFITYNGTLGGKKITVMAMGMGMPMMDFAVREMRAITKGPLAIIRMGSCGSPREDVATGTLVVAKNSFGITTNYDRFHAGQTKDPSDLYSFTLPIQPDQQLHDSLVAHVQKAELPVLVASDATADSFYGSQGRIDPNFHDQNTHLLDEILKRHPDTASLQMETFHLFHLGQLSHYAQASEKSAGKIRTAAAALVLANRRANDFLPVKKKQELEVIVGKAILQTLADTPLE
jgi:uridine phosphorylase